MQVCISFVVILFTFTLTCLCFSFSLPFGICQLSTGTSHFQKHTSKSVIVIVTFIIHQFTLTYCWLPYIVLKISSIATWPACSQPSLCWSLSTLVFFTAISIWFQSWLYLPTEISIMSAWILAPVYTLCWIFCSCCLIGLVDVHIIFCLLSKVEHSYSRLDQSVHLLWLQSRKP